MSFINKPIDLFHLCTRVRIMGIFLTCVLCTAGCTASDRAITFNNVKASEQDSHENITISDDMMTSDGIMISDNTITSDDIIISDDIITSNDVREICVYVCGEVNDPGVYSLAEGSRANDALIAAGGFTEEADKSYVNLAAKVNDGDRLYFPGISEATREKAAEEALKAGIVNINTADEALLCTLPGIGSSRAQDIISYRESNGPFESKEDIMKVSGIKDSAYQKICDKITIGSE